MSHERLFVSLGLAKLEGEGGLWAPLYRDQSSNAIYYAMVAPDFSAWHRLNEPELWIHLDGGAIELLTIEAGAIHSHSLNRSTGEFAYRVSAGTWMAARPKGDWTLAICALTPPFSGMEVATKHQLQAEFPNIKELPELFHE